MNVENSASSATRSPSGPGTRTQTATMSLWTSIPAQRPTRTSIGSSSTRGEVPIRGVSDKKSKARARGGNHGARGSHATLMDGFPDTKGSRRRRIGTRTDFPNHQWAARRRVANGTASARPSGRRPALWVLADATSFASARRRGVRRRSGGRVDKVALVAKLVANPGQGDDLLAAGEKMVAAAGGEPGTEVYVFHRRPGTDEVFVYEVYADESALAAHRASEAMLEFRATISGLLAETPEVIQLVPHDAKGVVLR